MYVSIFSFCILTILGLFYCLGSIVNFSQDSDVHFKYIQVSLIFTTIENAFELSWNLPLNICVDKSFCYEHLCMY